MRQRLRTTLGCLCCLWPATLMAQEGTLVVLNKRDASASLLDQRTGQEVARLKTGHGPHEAAVSPDGLTAVACNYEQQGRTLTVIDIRETKVVRTIELGEHTAPHGIQYISDSRVLVTTEGSQHLLVVDIASGEIVRAIETAQRVSHMVAATPDGRRAFVANIGDGTVTAIDIEAGEVLAQIECDPGTEGVDVSPDGREVWVSNRGSNTLTIIDADTLDVLETIPCPLFPIRVKFTPDGKRVLVSNASSGDVAVFDAATRKELTRVVMKEGWAPPQEGGNVFGQGPVPIGILIPPDGTHAYIANTNVDLITEIDLATLEITRRLTAGRTPDGMAYSPLRLVRAGADPS